MGSEITVGSLLLRRRTIVDSCSHRYLSYSCSYTYIPAPSINGMCAVYLLCIAFVHSCIGIFLVLDKWWGSCVSLPIVLCIIEISYVKLVWKGECEYESPTDREVRCDGFETFQTGWSGRWIN